MSKFKFTSPITLGAFVAFGAMSILGAPIGAPLMLGALGLAALGRNGVNAVQAYNQKQSSLEISAFNDKPWVDNPSLESSGSGYEEFTQDDISSDSNVELIEELLQINQPESYISRELLTENPTQRPTKAPTQRPTKSPTSSPTPAPTFNPSVISPYEVNNSATSGAYSFPAALAYVNSIGGAHNLTFGSGAYNQTCTINNHIPITSYISLDLAGMSPIGFTLDGSNSYFYIHSLVTTPTGLTFVSSAGNGNFALSRSYFRNNAAGNMTINVDEEGILTLSGSSRFWNDDAGSMLTNVNDHATLTLLGGGGNGGCLFFNNAAGSMITNVNDHANLTLSDSIFLNNALGSMVTNVNNQATLTLSRDSNGASQFQNYNAGSIITNINDQASLTLLGGSLFRNTDSGNMITNINDQASLALSEYACFSNFASGNMTTNINNEASLALSGYTFFSNFASGNMTTNINDKATVALSGGSRFGNDNLAGSMLTNINDEAVVALSDRSYFYNYGSGSMLINVNDQASLALSDSSYFQNAASGNMTTNVNGAASLVLSGGSWFENNAAGSMITNINDEASLTLSSSTYLLNSASGSMTTNVNGAATLKLSGGGNLQNMDSGTMIININDQATLAAFDDGHVYNDASGTLSINVNDQATLALSWSSSTFRNSGSGSMATTIYSGGTLSVDTGAGFYGLRVTVQGNGTFASGMGGANFWSNSLSLMPNATHIATIGSGSQPAKLMKWGSKPSLASNATIDGATLNVMSYQSLSSLQGSYTILTALAGNYIFGQYGSLKFNGSSIDLPYTISYTPSPISISSVDVIFPTPSPTPKPTVKAPTTIEPTPKPITAKPTTKAPSAEPSHEPSHEPSTELTTISIFPTCVTRNILSGNSLQKGHSKLAIENNSPNGISKVTITGDNSCLTMTGNSTLTVKNQGIMQILEGGAFSSFGNGGRAFVYGNVTVADGYFGYFGLNTGALFVYPQGILSVMSEGNIHKVQMTIAGNFTSEGGSQLEGSSIALLSNAIHNAIVGNQPIELLSYNGISSNATLGGALNVIGNISALIGLMPLWSTSQGGLISGSYNQLLINGLPANFTVVFFPNQLQATSVNLVFTSNSSLLVRRLLDVGPQEELVESKVETEVVLLKGSPPLMSPANEPDTPNTIFQKEIPSKSADDQLPDKPSQYSQLLSEVKEKASTYETSPTGHQSEPILEIRQDSDISDSLLQIDTLGQAAHVD